MLGCQRAGNPTYAADFFARSQALAWKGVLEAPASSLAKQELGNMRPQRPRWEREKLVVAMLLTVDRTTIY